MKSKNILLFFIAFLLVSCTSLSTRVPTTLIPTSTFLSSSPTVTPQPIFTITLSPTQTLTPVPTATFAPVPPRRSTYDTISGTYKNDRGSSEVCVLKIVLEPFILPDHEIVFELFCKQGPPSYRSGHVMAKVIILDNKATYSSPKLISGATCRLIFQFEKKMVTVKQSDSEIACGFEQGIHADGVYKLINDTPPILGCMNDENPCALDNPIP